MRASVFFSVHLLAVVFLKILNLSILKPCGHDDFTNRIRIEKLHINMDPYLKMTLKVEKIDFGNFEDHKVENIIH